MKPPFSYYGSKVRLAPWLASLLPPHSTYIEPFAGSAAVLMVKPVSRVEVLNDLNGEVVNFWLVLRERTADLVKALMATPYARDEYRACTVPATDELERARRFFVLTCQGFNSRTRSGGFSPAGPSKTKGPLFVRRVDRLREVADRIRAVEIENVDALTLINRWNREDTALYLDPPYVASTRETHGTYATENASGIFHTQLLAAVKEFRGSVVLSGYRSELYDEALSGWQRLDRDVPVATSNHQGTRRVECVWLNFDSPTSAVAA